MNSLSQEMWMWCREWINFLTIIKYYDVFDAFQSSSPQGKASGHNSGLNSQWVLFIELALNEFMSAASHTTVFELKMGGREPA